MLDRDEVNQLRLGATFDIDHVARAMRALGNEVLHLPDAVRRAFSKVAIQAGFAPVGRLEQVRHEVDVDLHSLVRQHLELEFLQVAIDGLYVGVQTRTKLRSCQPDVIVRAAGA